VTTTEHQCKHCPDHTPDEFDFDINDAMQVEGVGLVAMTDRQAVYVTRGPAVPMAAVTVQGTAQVDAVAFGRNVRAVVPARAVMILGLEQLAVLSVSLHRYVGTLSRADALEYDRLYNHARDVLADAQTHAGDLDEAAERAEAYANERSA
jgi:hypothetical protein